MRTIEQDLNTRELRRLRGDAKREAKLERLESEAEKLIGQLCREGKTVFYINLTDRNGRFTGKTKESATEYPLIAYMIRNSYVH